MKTSVMNNLRGKERGTVHGAVNSGVAVNPSGGQAIATVITRL
jgi:molybdopterin-binding protein